MQKMTVKELYNYGKTELNKAGIDSPAFDSMCLIEHFFGFDRQKLIIRGDTAPDASDIQKYLEAVEKRKNKYPLQYILGRWDFWSRTFFVGEGVLIPRADTEILVQKALEIADNITNPVIADLCSGSGAIAVSVAGDIPGSSVTAIELSPDAFRYLKKNIEINNTSNVNAIQGDIFKVWESFPDNHFDIILSNPPYIKSAEINTLQDEVRIEPGMALDGGTDGLDFYRKIISLWTSKLKINGYIIFEIGEDQLLQVSELLRQLNYRDIFCLKDAGSLDRVVGGIKA